jgi:hypothetical protein
MQHAFIFNCEKMMKEEKYFKKAQVEELIAEAPAAIAGMANEYGVRKVQEKLREIEQGGDEKITPEDIIKAFDDLANAFESAGAENPNLIDGISLYGYLGKAYPGLFTSKNFFNLVQLLTVTINSLKNLQNRDPNFSDDLLEYTMNLLKKNDYNVNLIEGELKDFISKSKKNSIYYDGFILSQIKSYKPGGEGQKQAAQAMAYGLLGSILENGGSVNENTSQDLMQLGAISNLMFGVKSPDQLNVINLLDAQGQLAFQKLSTSRDLYQAMIPVSEHYYKIQEDWMSWLDEKYKDKPGIANFMNNGIFSPIFRFISAGKGLYDGISGAAIGDAFKVQK